MNRYSLSFRLTLIATAIYFFICTICIALLIAVLSIDLEENLEAELEHHAHTIEALLPPLLTLMEDRHDESIMDAERITATLITEIEDLEEISVRLMLENQIIVAINDDGAILPQPNEEGLITPPEALLQTEPDLIMLHQQLLDDRADLYLWDTVSVYDEFQYPITLLLVLFFALLPVAFLLFHWSHRWALKPVNELATLISHRGNDHLERITIPRLPQELDPIITATNELLDKITELLNEQQAMLAREKRFTLNAAHELLTPLAALKTEMQLYQKAFIESDNAQADTLKELDRRVDRAVHTVEQLVTLARTETDIHQQTAFKALNLSDILQDITADLGNLIDEKNLALSYDVSDALMIQGEETQIHLLLKNILGNAIKYCPENGKLSCCAAQQGNHITITIRNDGRPIPDYLKEALFEPFVRGPGERESGSGLGLAIAKQICLLHNADLTLTNDSQPTETVCTTVTFKNHSL